MIKTAKNIIGLLIITGFLILSGGSAFAAPTASTSISSGGGGTSGGSTGGGGTAGALNLININTYAATNITTTSANLNGDFSGGPDITFFEYSNSLTELNAGSGTQVGVENRIRDNGLMNYILTGLTPNTTYYFRAGAKMATSTSSIYGASLNFTTTAVVSVISVNTSPASNITNTSAKINGSYSGGPEITFFEYSVSLTELNAGAGTQVGVTTRTRDNGLINYSLTGLTPNTTYYFRAGAKQNAASTTSIYGASLNFKTSNTITSSTDAATNITTTSAQLNGHFAGSPDTTFFQYSTSLTTLNAGTGTTVGTASQTTSSGTMSYNLTGLTASTTYYFRSAAHNSFSSSAPVYGAPLIFTTNSNTVNNGCNGCGGGYYNPYVTTTSSFVNGSSVTLYGSVNPHSYPTYAWFQYGTSSSSLSSESTHINEGSGNTIFGYNSILTLSPNTTYYFRAAASNSNGTFYGSILSFTTSVSINPPTVSTVIATNKTTTSARLHGVAVIPGSLSTVGYFEYGSTASLGSTTSSQNLGSSLVASFADTITGLNPNTIYYFRAVATNANGTAKGNIFVFKTSSISPNVIEENITEESPSVISENTVSSELLNITTSVDTVALGDEVQYFVTYKNDSSKNFENVKINIQLPQEVTFDGSTSGTVDSNNAVEFDPGTMAAGENDLLTINGHINANATPESVIVTTATMTYNLAGSLSEKNELAYVTNHVGSGNTLAGASILSLEKLLPQTFIGWLILILILIGLTIVGRKMYVSYSYNKYMRQNDSFHM